MKVVASPVYGVVAAMVSEPAIRIVGTYPKWGPGVEERGIFDNMVARDAARSPASKPLPVSQSHATPWGGVWSLRAPDVDVRR